MDPTYTARAPVRSHSATHAHQAPLGFGLAQQQQQQQQHHHQHQQQQQARLRGAEGSHGLSPLHVPGVNVNVVGSSPIFHHLPSGYHARSSAVTVAAATAAAAVTDQGFGGPKAALPSQRQHHDDGHDQHQQHRHQHPPQQRKQLPHQRQSQQDHRPSSYAAEASNVEFGSLAVTAADTTTPRNWSARSARASPTSDSAGPEASSHGGRLPVKLVENPPHLDEFRQKLFDLEQPVVLTEDQ